MCAAAGLMIAGCGGSGGTSRGTDPTPLPNGVVIDLPDDGAIDVSYVTGAGRAAGDLSALLKRVYFEDQYGEVRRDTNWSIRLNRYDTPTVVDVAVDFDNVSAASRKFDTFTLDLDRLVYTDADLVNRPITEITGIPAVYSGLADVRAFPGRRSSVQVFLDDSMFTIENPTEDISATFNAVRFREVNMPGNTAYDNKIVSRLSDFVSFDITQIPAADKPSLKPTKSITNPADLVARKVMLSGDGYMIASRTASEDQFQALTLNSTEPIYGRYTAASASPEGGEFPGTYSLLQQNPGAQDVENSKIISLRGIWFDHYKLVKNMPTTLMIAFPSSSDDRIQDVALIEQTAGSGGKTTINKMYFGFIEYNFATKTHKVSLYNLNRLVPGLSGTPDYTGVVTDLKNAGEGAAATPQQVRMGKFSVNTGALSGTAGDLVVFRK